MAETHTERTPPLRDKVKEWLETEGYPLEFRVARAFERQGFDTLQGEYVQNEKTGEPPREIDLVAAITADFENHRFFRISQVVECKWSRDKPWVIFSSPRSIMGEGACIAQAIGSRLGEAAMFCLAGDSALGKLELFKMLPRGGFSGRRALEKRGDKQDLFYGTIQGLIAKAVSEAKSYDSSRITAGQVPSTGCLVFPVIVIDGDLFEAHYDGKRDDVVLQEIQHIRVFWRGSTANSRWITPVDVVTVSSIDEFAKNRASDVKTLLHIVSGSIVNIQEAFKRRAFTRLEIKNAPRGFTGLPPLLADLYVLDKSKKRAKRLRKNRS